MNTIIFPRASISALFSIPEFKDSHAGFNFHGTGSMITPLGANVIITDSIESDIIGIDKNYAIEMVTAGGVQTEYDKLIDRQLERATISQITGFAKIFKDASFGISLT